MFVESVTRCFKHRSSVEFQKPLPVTSADQADSASLFPLSVMTQALASPLPFCGLSNCFAVLFPSPCDLVVNCPFLSENSSLLFLTAYMGLPWLSLLTQNLEMASCSCNYLKWSRRVGDILVQFYFFLVTNAFWLVNVFIEKKTVPPVTDPILLKSAKELRGLIRERKVKII